MKELREALPDIGTIDVEAIAKFCLEEHLSKVDRLIEWVENQLKNDPVEGLMEIDKTFRVMMAAHGDERRETWFKDKIDALNRQRSAIESKRSKYSAADAIDVKYILKNYRDTIYTELNMLDFKRRTLQKKRGVSETLKIMEVINGIKYERGS